MGNERNAESRVNDALRAEIVLKQESKTERYNRTPGRPFPRQPQPPSRPRAAQPEVGTLLWKKKHFKLVNSPDLFPVIYQTGVRAFFCCRSLRPCARMASSLLCRLRYRGLGGAHT